MKRILVPISFSKASKNSLFHSSVLFKRSHLTAFHIYSTQHYNRKFDFGSINYNVGIKDKMQKFCDKHASQISNKITLIASAGVTSEFIESKSKKYDLVVMSRKSHAVKKHGYLSDKKLFITTKAKCPVLIMPITEQPFNFEKCRHIWHVKRRESESKVVKKWNKSLHVSQDHVVEKSLQQHNYISLFWQSIVSYQHSHNKNLLKKIDAAHETEPIDLIILVDNDESVFTRFFQSDTVKLFCKYDIPILVLPRKK